MASQIQVGQKVSFHTYLIVREDALTLYGFTEILDRDFFELLLSVTGIGPKVAQSILATNSASLIASAIISSNLKVLEAVPGLGKKGAQRLVLELKEKVAEFAIGESDSDSTVTKQVENALQGLGYSSKEATAMLNQVIQDKKINTLSVEQVLKLALKSGGK
jgi:Holliday junction DNA helicase RuvA